MAKNIYLLRHAESEGNAHRRHLVGGQSNYLHITKRGWRQGEALGKRMGDELQGTVLVSPAVRTRETLDAMIRTCTLEESPIFDERLLEKSQGEWEGLVRAECYTPQVIKQMNDDPLHFKPPGAESMCDIQDRYEACIEDALANTDTLWVVGHGYGIKAYLQRVMRFDPALAWKVHIDNTSITQLKRDERGLHVMRINDAEHIRKLGYVSQDVYEKEIGAGCPAEHS